MQPKGGSLVEAIEARKAEADGKVCVDYALHGSITDWNDRTAGEVRSLVDGGVPTFKMFMIYRDEGWMADDASLYQALEVSKETGAQIGVHAESVALLDLLQTRLTADPGVEALGAMGHVEARPGVTEWEAIQRALAWAEATGGRLYVVRDFGTGAPGRGVWIADTLEPSAGLAAGLHAGIARDDGETGWRIELPELGAALRAHPGARADAGAGAILLGRRAASAAGSCDPARERLGEGTTLLRRLRDAYASPSDERPIEVAIEP